ncbi:MAG TPA: hypothetical protein VGI45_09090 [Terracidiphilus sp.]|jgi:hypothetical protein
MIEVLRQYLLAQSAITAITSKVIPLPAPESLSEYPLITYMVSSQSRNYGLSGSIGENAARIILRCFGPKGNESYDSAKLLSRAVIAACDGVQIPGQHIWLEVLNENDDFDTNNLINLCTVTLRVTTW